MEIKPEKPQRVISQFNIIDCTQTMTPYKSASGKKSGVIAYELHENSITVRFKDAIYQYTYSSAGSAAIEEMKSYAKAGIGLSTYIARNSPPYAGKKIVS